MGIVSSARTAAGRFGIAGELFSFFGEKQAMVARPRISRPFPLWCAHNSGTEFGDRPLHPYAVLG
jgi:hypothetical protein